MKKSIAVHFASTWQYVLYFSGRWKVLKMVGITQIHLGNKMKEREDQSVYFGPKRAIHEIISCESLVHAVIISRIDRGSGGILRTSWQPCYPVTLYLCWSANEQCKKPIFHGSIEYISIISNLCVGADRLFEVLQHVIGPIYPTIDICPLCVLWMLCIQSAASMPVLGITVSNEWTKQNATSTVYVEGASYLRRRNPLITTN